MIEYNQPVGNVRFVNILKTFKNILKAIVELTNKQNNTINFFIKENGYEFCFVNFKNPESWHQNDLMLAKVKITGKFADVKWINKMTANTYVSELNIVHISAASTGNSSRITPNNGETPFNIDLFKSFITMREAFNQFMRDFDKIYKKDNPVPSLNFVDEFLEKKPHWKSYIENSNSKSSNCVEWLLEDLRKFTKENGRTTDKERRLLNNDEYHLICKLLEKEGIKSGKIFYVLNGIVDDTV
jgi:hypothetical protein